MYAELQKVLGAQVGILGGNALYGDKSYVYCNGSVIKNGLTGLMLSGPLTFKIVQEPGKEPISPVLKITKLAENKREIIEVDDRPVLEVYREQLKGRIEPGEFDDIVARGEGAFGRISRRYPHAILKERDQLYVRLAHGLSPWGTGRYLPSECYDLQVGDRMVITKRVEDQIGCLRAGMRRLKTGMPVEPQLMILCPCQGNSHLMKDTPAEFVDCIRNELPPDASALGFFPCGEHCSPYEPDLDTVVGEARYHQLSYPMGSVVVLE
jgi:hypothetical protein